MPTPQRIWTTMAREFGVSFSLGANLDGSFGSSFKAASDRIGAVTQALRDMERSPVGKVGAAMSAQKDKIKAQVAELAGSLPSMRRRRSGRAGRRKVWNSRLKNPGNGSAV